MQNKDKKNFKKINIYIAGAILLLGAQITFAAYAKFQTGGQGFYVTDPAKKTVMNGKVGIKQTPIVVFDVLGPSVFRNILKIKGDAVVSGRVGVGGITPPASPIGLEVAGTIQASNDICAQSGAVCLSSFSGGGSIGGSGTVNYLPLWRSGTTLGNSIISQDAQGRVGINTAPGPYQLKVGGYGYTHANALSGYKAEMVGIAYAFDFKINSTNPQVSQNAIANKIVTAEALARPVSGSLFGYCKEVNNSVSGTVYAPALNSGNRCACQAGNYLVQLNRNVAVSFGPAYFSCVKP